MRWPTDRTGARSWLEANRALMQPYCNSQIQIVLFGAGADFVWYSGGVGVGGVGVWFPVRTRCSTRLRSRDMIIRRCGVLSGQPRRKSHVFVHMRIPLAHITTCSHAHTTGTHYNKKHESCVMPCKSCEKAAEYNGRIVSQ